MSMPEMSLFRLASAASTKHACRSVVTNYVPASHGQPCPPAVIQVLQQQQQSVSADCLQLTDCFLEEIIALDGMLME